MKHSDKNKLPKDGTAVFLVRTIDELSVALDAANKQGSLSAVILDCRGAETGARLSAGRLTSNGVPLIAVVEGSAKGWICDVIESVSMCYAENGTVFDFGVQGYSKRLIGSGSQNVTVEGAVSRDEAAGLGLINVGKPELSAFENAVATAERISEMAPCAVRACLEAVEGSEADGGYENESRLFADLFETDDMKRGTRAFLTKEKAEFEGK